MKKPVIIDTDFGGDPDDIFALTYALHSPEITIQAIFTSDEYQGNMRAGILKQWLKSGNYTIPVFSGKDLNNTKDFLLSDCIKDSPFIPHLFENKDIVEVLKKTMENNGCYVAIGGLTNLAYLYKTYPEYIRQLPIYIMGGAINYIRPDVAEHNIRLDISAAKTIFYADLQTNWFLSDYSFSPDFQISPQHRLYKTATKTPTTFGKLIFENMKQFYTNRYTASYLHDPITLSSIFLPTITYNLQNIAFEDNGRFTFSKEGKLINVSQKVNAKLFWNDFSPKMITALTIA